MNVSLTPELERLVSKKVRSGMYASASEVIREALRLLNEREELRRQKLEDLRKEIQIGIDQLNRGKIVPFDAGRIKSRLRRRLRESGGRKAR